MSAPAQCPRLFDADRVALLPGTILHWEGQDVTSTIIRRFTFGPSHSSFVYDCADEGALMVESTSLATLPLQ